MIKSMSVDFDNAIFTTGFTILLLLIVGCTSLNTADIKITEYSEFPDSIIPDSIERKFREQYDFLKVSHDIKRRLSLETNFDSDGIPDYVTTVLSLNQSRLLMVYLSSQDSVHLLTRNAQIQYPNPQNIKVLDPKLGFEIVRKKPLGNMLLVAKIESSSAVLFLTEHGFDSKWLSE